MSIRITGMNSGLDTESIIAELVKVEQKKVETTKKEKTTFEWKQEAWKELNAKIYKLFNSTLNNMRFAGDWSKKATSVSNSSVASVVTADDAMNASQELKVHSLASAGYMTSGKVTTTDGSTAGNFTTLGDLGFADSEVEITLKVGETEKTLTVSENTNMWDFAMALRDAGVDASYDQANGRFHIAAKNNGEKISFSAKDDSTNIEAGSANDALARMGLLTNTKKGEDGKEVEDPSSILALWKIKQLNAEGDPYKHEVLESRLANLGAHSTGGDKAKITLNGVEYESSNNTFSINGLTITAKQTGDAVLNTKRDTNGVYNTVKNFIKEYSALINEMDKLYNAESAKGYEPLTDEEKDAMSENEIEKWEDKIKSAVLRRDSTLNTISSSLKEIMLQGATVNGKKMYLSNFGIETLGYYNAEENEKNAYHIHGDEDFPSVLTETNQLKAMTEQDPDTVIEFFSQLSNNLYQRLNKLSSSVEGVRSFGKFYDDKLMEEEYKTYESKIAKQEKALTEKEDKWYEKFSAMETALAKMQSNQNALASLLGG